MVICQSSELGWEVTVEFLTDSLSIGRGSVIIYRYGVPHELISDRGAHFSGEVDTLIQEYGIQHHRSSAYRP